MLVLVVALLVAGLVAERPPDERTDDATADALAAAPAAARPGSLGSTWYCASGTASGADGEAEQTVHMANGSARPVGARVTAYPSEGEPVTRSLEVPALSRIDVLVRDLVQAPYASVLAEFDGGEVAVQHELRGPAGRSLSPCASTPSDTWFFPQATTRAGAKLVLSLFNPFPNDAVVDVNMEAEDGARTPQAYQGLVVPGGRVTTLDVSEVVTLRQELATSVIVRSGRLVAEQVQIATDAEGLPSSIAAMLGAPDPEAVWLFPDGVGAEGYQERVVLYNPGDESAEVDVEVLLDDPENNGVAEPFEVTVQPQGFTTIDVFGDGRVPAGVAHAIVVRARNDVPIVAQRTIVGIGDAGQPGVSYTLGSPVVAGRWLAPTGALAGASGAALILFNPSPTEAVTVSARAFGGGRYETVAGLDGATVAPLGRIVIDVGPDGLGANGFGPGELALEVESDSPLVAESRFGFEEGDDLAYLVAVAVDGTIEAPTAVVGELSDQSVVLGGD
jgi:hypothetical protein